MRGEISEFVIRLVLIIEQKARSTAATGRWCLNLIGPTGLTILVCSTLECRGVHLYTIHSGWSDLAVHVTEAYEREFELEVEMRKIF